MPRSHLGQRKSLWTTTTDSVFNEFGSFYRKFRGWEYVPEQDWVHGERQISIWGKEIPKMLPPSFETTEIRFGWKDVFYFPRYIRRTIRYLRKFWKKIKSRGHKFLRKRKFKLYYVRNLFFWPQWMNQGSKKRRRRRFLKPWRSLWKYVNDVFPAFWRPLTRIMIGPIIFWGWILFAGVIVPYPEMRNPPAYNASTLQDYETALTTEKDHLGHMTDLEYRFQDTSHAWTIRRTIIQMAEAVYDWIITHFGWVLGYGKMKTKDLPSAPEKILDYLGLQRIDVWNVIGGPFVPAWEHPLLIDWEGKLQLYLTRQLKTLLNFYETKQELDQEPQISIYDDYQNVRYGIFTLPFQGLKSNGILFGITAQDLNTHEPERFISLKLLLPEFSEVIRLDLPELFSTNPKFDVVSEELQKKYIPPNSDNIEHQWLLHKKASHPHMKGWFEPKLI